MTNKIVVGGVANTARILTKLRTLGSHLIILPQSFAHWFVKCYGGSTVNDVGDRLRKFRTNLG